MPHTNVLADIFLADTTPMIIWAVLIVLTVPAMLMLANPQGLYDPRQACREIVAFFRRCASGSAPRLARAEAIDAHRYAAELRVCAQRAQAAAEQWQQRLAYIEQERLASWQAWLDAETRLRESLAATAFGTPWSVPTCEEYAARERFMRRAVAAAVGRGDLPGAAIADAWAGRNGWDARLHPLEQELVINRAAARFRRQSHELAARAEQMAWQDTESASRAAASLRREHLAAALRAGQLSHLLPAHVRSPEEAPRRIAQVRTV